VAKHHPIAGERLEISVDDVVRAVVGP
jgi:hypothetical protein